MKYFEVVQRFQTLRYLQEDIPNLWFWYECTLLLAIDYPLKQISVIHVLHYYARYQNDDSYHRELLA